MSRRPPSSLLSSRVCRVPGRRVVRCAGALDERQQRLRPSQPATSGTPQARPATRRARLAVGRGGAIATLAWSKARTSSQTPTMQLAVGRGSGGGGRSEEREHEHPGPGDTATMHTAKLMTVDLLTPEAVSQASRRKESKRKDWCDDGEKYRTPSDLGHESGLIVP